MPSPWSGSAPARAACTCFSADATCLGVILVPEVVANFTWGGDDMRSIFLTASTSLYRARTNTRGLIRF